MAPLANAMRLIDRDEAHTRPLEHPFRAARGQPLRRHVKQLEASLLQPAPDGVGLLFRVARGQRPRRNPRLTQGAHLVAHQRNQRRDHHRDALSAQRGQLEAQRFPAPRRHDRQHVFARDHGLHDLLLAGAEAVESEDGRKKGGRIRHGACICGFSGCADGRISGREGQPQARVRCSISGRSVIDVKTSAPSPANATPSPSGA